MNGQPMGYRGWIWLNTPVGICFAVIAAMGCQASVASSRATREARSTPAHVMQATPASRKIAAIGARRIKCSDGAMTSPVPIHVLFEGCSDAAKNAYEALTPRSRNKARLRALQRDMFEPLVFVMTPDEDNHTALVADVTIIASYADFAAKRAAILTGAASAPSSWKKTVRAPGLFYWVDATPGLTHWMSDLLNKRRLAASFERQWDVIRNADCAAYPVPRCVERLDDALRQMFAEIKK